MPPLPGAVATPVEIPPLASRLWALLGAAERNIISAPATAPDDPSIIDEFAAIEAAAAKFEIAPGVGLSDLLWTHGKPFRRGEVAARLRALEMATGKTLQAFLLLYAAEIGGACLFGPNMTPFRCAEPIDAPVDATGPFLVLIVCHLAADGRAEAIRGYAQPVLSGRRFLPVGSPLERDMLHALIDLQAKLDAHGLDLTIVRALSGAEPTDVVDITLTIENQAGAVQELRTKVTDQARAEELDASAESAIFVVTPKLWADGSFIGWLEREISV